MIVLDASAAVELLLNTTRAASVRHALFGERSHAPHLLDVEVAQVLRRFRQRGELTRPEVVEAVEDLAMLPIRRHAHSVLLPRIVELSDNATAYDACYLALAEMLRAKLVTCDAKVARVPGSTATVDVIR